MISVEVENFLHQCFVSARTARMESISVEYMVLKMLDEPALLAHFKASAIDPDRMKSELQQRVDAMPVVSDEAEPDTQPTMEFQRVLQKAIMAVQQRDDDEVFLLDLLVAVVGEKNSFAARLLMGSAVDPAEVQACGLCRNSTTASLLTVVPGRGVICAECLAAVRRIAT